MSVIDAVDDDEGACTPASRQLSARKGYRCG